jgi:hypothetical protein
MPLQEIGNTLVKSSNGKERRQAWAKPSVARQVVNVKLHLSELLDEDDSSNEANAAIFIGNQSESRNDSNMFGRQKEYWF